MMDAIEQAAIGLAITGFVTTSLVTLGGLLWAY